MRRLSDRVPKFLLDHLEMSTAAGIDLGNQYCVVGVPCHGGVDIVPNCNSSRLIPTKVCYTGTRRYNGDDADQQQMMYVDGTISEIKRLFCLPFNSKERELIQSVVAFKMAELPDGYTGIVVNYQDSELILRPEQCLAYILRSMAKLALTKSNKIEQFVISVSPWWPERQRRALFDAARIAGYQKITLINSTTAAAVTYSVYHSNRLPDVDQPPVYMAFVDFGNSSMNVAIAEMNKFKVVIKSFTDDNHLGGSYFTEPLVRYLADIIQSKYKVNPFANPRIALRFWNATEKLKKTLSINPVVNFECTSMGNDQDISFLVKREEYNNIIQDLLQRIPGPIESALTQAGITKDQLFGVEVLGGGSRVVAVKNKIAEVFGQEPSSSLNLDECFAIGSGYMASIIAGYTKNIEVHDVAPYPFNAEWSDGHPKCQELFKQFSPVPSCATIVVKVVGKTPIRVVSNGEEVASVEIVTGIPEAIDVTVKFYLTQSSTIEITNATYVSPEGIDKIASINYLSHDGLTDEEIEKFSKLEDEMEENDKIQLQIDDQFNNLQEMIFKAQGAVRDFPESFDPENLEAFKTKIDEFSCWFSENEFDRQPLNEYTDRIKKLKDEIEPAEKRHRLFSELIDNLEPIKKQLNNTLKAVEEDIVHQEDPVHAKIQEDIKAEIQRIEEFEQSPKHIDPEFDVEQSKKNSATYQTRANKLKAKIIKPTEPEPSEQELYWGPRRMNDPRRQQSELDEEEDYYDPFSALFGVPRRRVARPTAKRGRPIDPWEVERKRREELEQQREFERRRQIELQRQAQLEARRRAELEAQRRAELEEQRRAAMQRQNPWFAMNEDSYDPRRNDQRIDDIRRSASPDGWGSQWDDPWGGSWEQQQPRPQRQEPPRRPNPRPFGGWGDDMWGRSSWQDPFW